MDIVTISHEDLELLEFFCMADYMGDCTDVPAEEVVSKTFNVEMKNRNTS